MPETVLIVEDDPNYGRMLHRGLNKAGLATTVVGDGRLALLAAKSAPPDLILLDLALPDFNGFELLRLLHADPRTSTTPIILLTAIADEDGLIESATAMAPAAAFLHKTLPLDTIIKKVQTTLQRPENGVLRRGALRFCPFRRTAWIGERAVKLTPSRSHVLHKIIRSESGASPEELGCTSAALRKQVERLRADLGRDVIVLEAGRYRVAS